MIVGELIRLRRNSNDVGCFKVCEFNLGIRGRRTVGHHAPAQVGQQRSAVGGCRDAHPRTTPDRYKDGQAQWLNMARSVHLNDRRATNERRQFGHNDHGRGHVGDIADEKFDSRRLQRFGVLSAIFFSVEHDDIGRQVDDRLNVRVLCATDMSDTWLLAELRTRNDIAAKSEQRLGA